MAKVSIKASSKPRIFLFHGEDDYTSSVKARLWIESFAKKHGSSGVSIIDAESEDGWLEKLKGALFTSGLFSSVRLIVLKNIFARKAEEAEPFLELLDQVPEESFLLVWERERVKKTLRLYKKFTTLEGDGRAKISSHQVPVADALDLFIADYCRDKKMKLAPAAAKKFVALLGRDASERVKTAGGYEERPAYNLWQVTQELDKLAAYKSGVTILPVDVEQLVPGKFSENIFLFTGALAARDKLKARRYLSELLSHSGNAGDLKSRALPIVGAVASQFRSLLALAAARQASPDTSSLADRLGWSAYRVRANLPLLGRFTVQELEQALRELLAIDRKLKTTSLPAKVLLSRLVESSS
ncbi:MAG: hypothetical protein HY397_02455 [Candidatus Doudnabacteria bacterium]|nr:hypothetical protein [Candidatus Doudnabacteria bacterium]